MEIIKKMVETFDEEYLSLKVVEECNELSEVLVKRITKLEKYRPPLKKVIEEMGDVLFRMAALSEKLGINKEVNERKKEKAEQIEAWFNEDKK